mmetsp:Transcript_4095/g.14314  ORF Transcript_4095/g.14314 Transcript_4095/m.14314 type:complete len:468 (-) Transcript_4095:955-2358(-)
MSDLVRLGARNDQGDRGEHPEGESGQLLPQRPGVGPGADRGGHVQKGVALQRGRGNRLPLPAPTDDDVPLPRARLTQAPDALRQGVRLLAAPGPVYAVIVAQSRGGPLDLPQGPLRIRELVREVDLSFFEHPKDAAQLLRILSGGLELLLHLGELRLQAAAVGLQCGGLGGGALEGGLEVPYLPPKRVAGLGLPPPPVPIHPQLPKLGLEVSFPGQDLFELARQPVQVAPQLPHALPVLVHVTPEHGKHLQAKPAHGLVRAGVKVKGLIFGRGLHHNGVQDPRKLAAEGVGDGLLDLHKEVAAGGPVQPDLLGLDSKLLPQLPHQPVCRFLAVLGLLGALVRGLQPGVQVGIRRVALAQRVDVVFHLNLHCRNVRIQLLNLHSALGAQLPLLVQLGPAELQRGSQAGDLNLKVPALRAEGAIGNPQVFQLEVEIRYGRPVGPFHPHNLGLQVGDARPPRLKLGILGL